MKIFLLKDKRRIILSGTWKTKCGTVEMHELQLHGINMQKSQNIVISKNTKL